DDALKGCGAARIDRQARRAVYGVAEFDLGQAGADLPVRGQRHRGKELDGGAAARGVRVDRGKPAERDRSVEAPRGRGGGHVSVKLRIASPHAGAALADVEEVAEGDIADLIDEDVVTASQGVAQREAVRG